MLAWLQGLIWALPGWVRAPAQIIISGLIRTWTWFDALARAAIPGWTRMESGAVWLASGLIELGKETVGATYWIVFVAIPRAAQHTLNAAITWSAMRLVELRAWAAELIGSMLRWVVDRIRDLLDLVDGLRRWTIGQLAAVIGAVNRLIGRVFDDWANPHRLAVWLVAAMWSAIWSYVWSNVDRYVDWLWARRRVLLLRGAAEIERILARLL